jgi:hypothetical protein
MDLDPGIARYVEVLRAARVETLESCQGGEGHSAVEPIVRFLGGRSEGFRAPDVALAHGFPVLDLRRYSRQWMTASSNASRCSTARSNIIL